MQHDPSYMRLFSHPEMVADLLKGFVREDWVNQLDLTTLERVSGSFVTDDLRDRDNDIIWRVRWGREWLYVYLLIEFQSSVDRHMAVRIMAYVALLYQDLIAQEQVPTDGQLPPVLPLVLYNGRRPWQAPCDISDLIHPVPGHLGRYRPSLRYLLTDESRFTNQALPEARNLAAALIGLENSRTPKDVTRVR